MVLVSVRLSSSEPSYSLCFLIAVTLDNSVLRNYISFGDFRAIVESCWLNLLMNVLSEMVLASAKVESTQFDMQLWLRESLRKSWQLEDLLHGFVALLDHAGAKL